MIATEQALHTTWWAAMVWAGAGLVGTEATKAKIQGSRKPHGTTGHYIWRATLYREDTK